MVTNEQVTHFSTVSSHHDGSLAGRGRVFKHVVRLVVRVGRGRAGRSGVAIAASWGRRTRGRLSIYENINECLIFEKEDSSS